MSKNHDDKNQVSVLEQSAKQTPTGTEISHTQLSDHDLYELCRQYGARTLEWRRKFIGLLPEVNRREQTARTKGTSWLGQKGYGSIFEFAAKLAGISEEMVRRTINLEKRFSDKPILQKALLEGKISIHKLIRIAPVATMENAELLLKQAQMLSTRAVGTLAKDEKILRSRVDGNSSPQQSIQIVKEYEWPKENIALHHKTAARLRELEKKGMDLDNLINEIFDQHEQKLAEDKEKVAEQISVKANHTSRYIPVGVKKILQREHGTKCSIPHCQRLAVSVHHTRRFSLASSHDPHYLAPLCHEHHQIAHLADLKYWQHHQRVQ